MISNIYRKENNDQKQIPGIFGNYKKLDIISIWLKLCFSFNDMSVFLQNFVPVQVKRSARGTFVYNVCFKCNN